MNSLRAKSIGFFFLKFLGTSLFLYWAISQIEDKQAFVDHFRKALQSPLWVTAGISLAGLSVLTAAMRWQVLLFAQNIREPFWHIFRLTLYGSLFNIASLGAAAGDAVKIIALIRKHPEKKVPITISVMIDHLVGFLATGFIFLFFAWGLGEAQAAKGVAGQKAFLAATIFQAGGIVFVFLSFLSCSPAMMDFCKRKMPKIAENKWVQSITTAMDLFRSRWRYAFMSLAISLVLSAAYFLTFYAALRCLNETIPATTILTVMPIVDVVAAMPISISGIGVREQVFEFLLSQLTGITKSAAVSASLIGFIFHVFWGIIGGITFLAAKSSSNKPQNA